MSDPVYATVDAALRKRGRTWAWMADKLGVTDQVVNNWSRRRVPSNRYLDIAQILGWTAEQLVSGELEPDHGIDFTYSDGSTTILAQVKSPSIAGLSPGAAAERLAEQLASLPQSRRETIAGLIALMVKDGPNTELRTSIDLLAPGVSAQAAPADVSWRAEAFRLAERTDSPLRGTLVDFVTAVDKWVVQESAKKQASGGEYRTDVGTAIVGS